MAKRFARWNPEDASLEADYREGFPLADVMHGAEARPWDRVLHGIANVLQKRGVSISHMKVAEIWHYPTASFNDQMSAAEVWKWIDSALVEDFQRHQVYEYSDRHFDHLVSLAHPYRSYHPGELDFDRAVNDLIDREIKRGYPKVRRGTKKYAELRDQVIEQAKKIVSDEVRSVQKGEREKVADRYERDIVPALQGVAGRIRWLRMRAGHVTAVLGPTKNVATILSEADRLEQKATNLDAYWQSVLSGGADS